MFFDKNCNVRLVAYVTVHMKIVFFFLVANWYRKWNGNFGAMELERVKGSEQQRKL